jgi:hypothetical protein
MVDKEEQVELHNVLDMVEKVKDKVKDVKNGYTLDLLMMVLMDQVKKLKFALFAIVQDDQMHLVENIVLVVPIHKYPKKVDRLDQVMNDKLDHYHNHPVIMIHNRMVTDHCNPIYQHHMMMMTMVMANVIVFGNYLMMNRMENIDHDDCLRIVNDHHLTDYIYR